MLIPEKHKYHKNHNNCQKHTANEENLFQNTFRGKFVKKRKYKDVSFEKIKIFIPLLGDEMVILSVSKFQDVSLWTQILRFATYLTSNKEHLASSRWSSDEGVR